MSAKTSLVGGSRRLNVLFAPDYRAANPYQPLLAEALSGYGVDVAFLSDYRRVLPLARGAADAAPDILHLHWPEAYFSCRDDRLDRLRVQRYPLDLWLAARRRPFVVTAHNLLPHNRGDEVGVFRNIRLTMRRATAVFAHAETARAQLAKTFGIPEGRIDVIPFGDHSVTLGRPMPRDEARRVLALPPLEKICLMFGTVSPYKGIVDVVRMWREAHVPHRLVVVGPVVSSDYANEVQEVAGNAPTIDLHLARDWLDEDVLRTWLSVADCVIFNYRNVFTSGAGGLARSYGVPSVIPLSAATLDLGEPHEHVVRFESISVGFREAIERALATPCDYAKAQDWRQRTSWDVVAAHTARTYQKIVGADAECRYATKTFEMT